jgi:hypothetical protein
MSENGHREKFNTLSFNVANSFSGHRKFSRKFDRSSGGDKSTVLPARDANEASTTCDETMCTM